MNKTLLASHQLDICGLGGGLQKFKQLPDQNSLWPENGPTCQKQLRKSTSRNGLSKNRRSTMLEDRNIYLENVESSRKQFKTHGKSWRSRWKWLPTSCGKPTTKSKDPTKTKRQSMHALWRLMNPRVCVSKELYRNIRKITSRRKGSSR